MAHSENVYALVHEIHAASERLRGAMDVLHKGLGLTTAMHGVLDTLSARGALTVPQIARERRVTRQHVQVLVDGLWDRRLVTFLTNPGHARSPLVDLTGKGRAVHETCTECHRALVQDLSSAVTSDVGTALAVIRRLNAVLLRRSAGSL